MKKICVFCGGTPRSKTKEHVVPRWLLKMAPAGAQMRVWVPWSNRVDPSAQVKTMGIESLTFPACDECNSRFSTLESAARGVLVRMLAGHALSSFDFDAFLDWLDKLRVSAWLGMRYLEKDVFGVTPNFFVRQRVGAKDRLAVIYRTPHQEHLTLLGTSTAAFHFQPSCFSLVIGPLCILNVSSDFLLASALGLPQLAGFLQETNEFAFHRGTGHFDLSNLDLPVAPGGVAVCQPKLAQYSALALSGDEHRHLEQLTARASEHKPFVFVGGGMDEYPPAPTTKWVSPSIVLYHWQQVFLRQTLRIQNQLMALNSSLDPTQMTKIADCISSNNSHIAELDRRRFRA